MTRAGLLYVGIGAVLALGLPAAVTDVAAGRGTDDQGVEEVWRADLPARDVAERVDAPPASELLDRVDDVSRQLGLRVRSAQVLRSPQNALSVSFVVPDGLRPHWTVDQLREALVGTKPIVEGALITLVSDDGHELLVAGTAYRTGEGGLWFAPGQDERFGALHSHVARVE